MDFIGNLVQSVVVVLIVMLLFLGFRTGMVVASLIPPPNDDENLLDVPGWDRDMCSWRENWRGVVRSDSIRGQL